MIDYKPREIKYKEWTGNWYQFIIMSIVISGILLISLLY